MLKAALTALLAALVAPSARAQSLTQEFLLQPGWNALWIEVDPPDRSPDAVFATLPIASVWTWSERVSATDFIQNPETAGWNRAQWLAWFPPDSPEAPLANLYAVLPQRAYLVRLAGTEPVHASVTGRPIHRTPDWSADRFNLRGFPVDDSVAPTFRQFFRSSSAHFDSRSGRLEPIFRLGSDGQWQAVSPDDRMRRGEAYWVSTRGPSDFVAPFHLSLNTGDHATFNAVLRRVELTLHNLHAAPKSIRIEPAGPHASPLLLLPPTRPGQTNAPRPLETHDQPLSAGAGQQVHLGLDRSQLTNSPATNPTTGVHATLLRVSDNEGTLYHVGVTATLGAVSDYSGLWLGTVTLTDVAPTAGTPGEPGPVTANFPLRLLLHVDAGGQVSLLRDVTLVYSRTNTPAGSPENLAGLAPTELVTDPSRLFAYAASDLRSGAVRGRRITAPHFEFARTNGQFTLPLSGTFAPDNTVTGTLQLPGDHPGNPFLHRYHPDHGTNAYAVSRDLRLVLAPDPSPPPGGGGGDTLGGTYTETLSGLHKLPLQVAGSVQLRRLTTLGVLNAGSTP